MLQSLITGSHFPQVTNFLLKMFFGPITMIKVHKMQWPDNPRYLILVKIEHFFCGKHCFSAEELNRQFPYCEPLQINNRVV